MLHMSYMTIMQWSLESPSPSLAFIQSSLQITNTV